MSGAHLPETPPAVTVLDSWTWTPPWTPGGEIAEGGVIDHADASAPPTPPPPTATTAARAEDDGPTAAEIAAVLALPRATRDILRRVGGPGWAVLGDGIVESRTRPPKRLDDMVPAWLPASEWGIVACGPRVEPGGSRGIRQWGGAYDAWNGNEMAHGDTARLAALRLLAWAS